MGAMSIPPNRQCNRYCLHLDSSKREENGERSVKIQHFVQHSPLEAAHQPHGAESCPRVTCAGRPRRECCPRQHTEGSAGLVECIRGPECNRGVFPVSARPKIVELSGALKGYTGQAE